jgi:phosphate transport system substrate-binding protein
MGFSGDIKPGRNARKLTEIMITEGIKYVMRSLFMLLLAAVILPGCGTKEPKGPGDTPTSGRINISVDESFVLLFETQIHTFESIYPKAKINASYKPEGDVVTDLFSDSVRVVVIARDLNEQEWKMADAKKIQPKSVKIAEDAVALIVHADNKDSLLTVDQLRNILSGKDTLWSQLNEKSPLGKINVVFDNNSSANARYLQETLMNGAGFNDNCFAVKSNPEVIEYVKTHKNALGVISVNWISDSDDTLSTGFLRHVRVVSVSKGYNADYYKPFQAYIKTKEYALCRDVYMIYRGKTHGLGTGFASFVAGDKGQRIILKSGLVPATSPVRVVEINTK